MESNFIKNIHTLINQVSEQKNTIFDIVKDLPNEIENARKIATHEQIKEIETAYSELQKQFSKLK